MAANSKLSADLQIAFYYRLKNIKNLYFHEALGKAIHELAITELDKEVSTLVSNESLQKLASFSLRAEAVYATPLILKANPSLLGYYRLLYGFSQKEFYGKGRFGTFKSMEDKGILSPKAESSLVELCKQLAEVGEQFTKEIDNFTINILTELQLLTVGPQLRGALNNKYGQAATEKLFSFIKELVEPYIIIASPTSIHIKNAVGRTVNINFSSDPDISITEIFESSKRGLLSIEIKGGRDAANIHNRIGEAEKSHQKAKRNGYNEFMTLISVEANYEKLREESPTTSHFFHLDKISNRSDDEYQQFKDILASLLSINI